MTNFAATLIIIMINASGIHKSYGALEVLKGVSLTVNKGEIISITGASGAGKSTLLHIISTLDKADSGEIVIDGIDVKKLDDKKLSDFRNKKVGFVFQFHHLLPEFTALENICIPAYIAGINSKTAQEKAKELLDLLKMSDRMDHKPSELSGGEQQRVAIARALINNPSVIMADEPSGNLDSVNAKQLHSLFFELRDHFNQTIIIVTHNEELAEMADRRIYMRDGLIYDYEQS
jgi:lipoprotein-releasing system ATP-binding protein